MGRGQGRGGGSREGHVWGMKLCGTFLCKGMWGGGGETGGKGFDQGNRREVWREAVFREDLCNPH